MPQKRTRVFNQYSNLGLNDVIAGPRCEQHKTPRELDSASKSFKPDNRQSAIFNEHKDITASKQGCVQSYLVPLKDTPGSSERSPAFPERPTSNDQFPAVPISE
ncbi:hypothetical protein HZH66_004705 [Vespula vulgaris]|uniref:Uncharacterized protein n=1 Tax=Vespula vulgaris TaxID=7454 RepID=A0A834NCI9_VESVU|nr:hypothetical protein HZH66_004705 [Vespula vulgaris]